MFVHLAGAARLRSSRKRLKVISDSTKQLNEIGAFLTLLARTVLFQPSVSVFAETDDSATCYEFMYGIAPETASAIRETCRISELMAEHGGFSNRSELPAEVVEACEELGEGLLSWSLDTEKISATTIKDDLMLRIYKHHANAWHQAAMIYYLRRIQNCDSIDLIEEVDRTMDHMFAVERVKAEAGLVARTMVAPITWPMFIASCEAIGPARDRCRAWWEEAITYQLVNMTRQWEAIQRIWERLEQLQQDGRVGMSWVDVYCEVSANVLIV